MRLQYRGTGHAQGEDAGNSPRAFQLSNRAGRLCSICHFAGVREADLHMWIPPTQKEGCALLSRYATSPFHTVKQEPATALSPSLEHTL